MYSSVNFDSQYRLIRHDFPLAAGPIDNIFTLLAFEAGRESRKDDTMSICRKIKSRNGENNDHSLLAKLLHLELCVSANESKYYGRYRRGRPFRISCTDSTLL